MTSWQQQGDHRSEEGRNRRRRLNTGTDTRKKWGIKVSCGCPREKEVYRRVEGVRMCPRMCRICQKRVFLLMDPKLEVEEKRRIRGMTNCCDVFGIEGGSQAGEWWEQDTHTPRVRIMTKYIYINYIHTLYYCLAGREGRKDEEGRVLIGGQKGTMWSQIVGWEFNQRERRMGN